MCTLRRSFRGRFFALALFATLFFVPAFAQTALPVEVASLPDAPGVAGDGQSATPSSTTAQSQSAQNSGATGQQTKRILGIVPNFRSVSANAKLPPESPKEKFMEATEDSFDYSSFIFAGILAGVAQAEGSYPEFHTGAPAFARYYWHTFADQTDENYQVEFIFPAVLHQDSRYYTLGHGGFVKRTVYSFSRVLITRTDHGSETFNASEIVGAGAASGISSLYYPSPERTWTKTGQRWLLNVSLDGGTFIFKEFWPDLNNKFFHQKD